MALISIHCPHCDSDNIVRDAVAAWSVKIQAWELVTVYDNMSCNDCEREFKESTVKGLPNQRIPRRIKRKGPII